MEASGLRDQLILLSMEKKYKKKFLPEATEETLQKIWQECELEQLDETNRQLALLVTTKFSEFMKAMELVKDQYQLEKDLTKNDLLQKDTKKFVSYIMPYIPWIGNISGGVTVGGHVFEKMFGEKESEEGEEEETGTRQQERRKKRKTTRIISFTLFILFS